MKSFINFVAIILIIFGIVSLGYNRFSYSSKEKIAQVGDVEVSANTEKTVYLSPTVGGISIAVGVILLVIGRLNK